MSSLSSSTLYSPSLRSRALDKVIIIIIIERHRLAISSAIVLFHVVSHNGIAAAAMPRKESERNSMSSVSIQEGQPVDVLSVFCFSFFLFRQSRRGTEAKLCVYVCVCSFAAGSNRADHVLSLSLCAGVLLWECFFFVASLFFLVFQRRKRNWCNCNFVVDFFFVSFIQLASLTVQVGYPEQVLASSYLDEFYTAMSVQVNDFLGNILYGVHFLRKVEERVLLNPLPEHKWLPALSRDYISYIPESNRIVIPEHILLPPFYSLNYPQYEMIPLSCTIMMLKMLNRLGFVDNGRASLVVHADVVVELIPHQLGRTRGGLARRIYRK